MFLGAKSGQHFLKGMLLSFAIIAADQYTKWLIVERKLVQTLTPQDFQTWLITRQMINPLMDMTAMYRQIEVTSFLNLTMVWNRGVSFGMFNTMGDKGPLILSAIALLISILMIVWMAVVPRLLPAIGLAMIVGGAIGNVIDRVRFGAVADFVDLHYAGWHWPAFNLADSCIVLGAAFLILDSFLLPAKTKEDHVSEPHEVTK